MTRVGTEAFDLSRFQRSRVSDTSTVNSDVSFRGPIETGSLLQMSLSDLKSKSTFLKLNEKIVEAQLRRSEVPTILLQSERFELDSQWRELKAKYTPSSSDSMPQPGHSVHNEFASIKVGGTVVATVTNYGQLVIHGSADGSNAKRINAALFPDGRVENRFGPGPDKAADLAARTAAIMGGRVEISRTAITQLEFFGFPVSDYLGTVPTLDHEAMMDDPMYELLNKREEEYQTALQANADRLTALQEP